MEEEKKELEAASPEAAAPVVEKKEPESVENTIYCWAQALITAVVGVVLLFTFGFRLIGVSGPSMQDTLYTGDRLLVLNAMFCDFKPGDVVVINDYNAELSDTLVKRIIAVGGQTVDIDSYSGVVYVDGKPVMAADVELHKHVSIQEEKGMPFYLRVSVKGNRPEDMTLHMNGSFIVGRAQICNLYFDDKRMSRQHFVLEWDGQNMYVTDLETTNGTQVNQVPIHQKRRLQQNDVISAGSVDMTIRW